MFSTNLKSETTESPSKSLTQKEYLLTVRNRLFAIEEQIWLHEYALAHPGSTKVEALSEPKYNQLLRARGDLMDEYPSTRLYTDLYETQQRNLTYASIFVERMLANFNRQIPLPMDHVNQIAVLSSQGQVVNLMRGQGSVQHRLLPSNVLADQGMKRQFQHPGESWLGGQRKVEFVQTGQILPNECFHNVAFSIC